MLENRADETEAPKAKNTESAENKKAGTQKTPISLGELVRNSNNEEAKKLKEEIDSLRKKRDKLISDVKSYRRSINYKRDEYAALSKFLENESNIPDPAEINKLKKLKNRLEFKLSTEPRMTLDMERDLVRKINEAGTELNSKLRYSKLKKKTELLKSDIEQYSARAEETFKEINSMNDQFDKLYSELKKLLGIENNREGHGHSGKRPSQQYRKRPQLPQEQLINLEDIAVIKRKTDKTERVEE